MPNPLVSVIIPTYNRAYCLARTIDSALRQTHSPIEVLVVDDGSADGTRDLIHGRYAADQRVRYLYQPNAGVSHARNKGLAAAQGEFLALLDSDDFWHPWKLQVQLAALDRVPEAGMVWTDMEAVDADGNIFDHRYLRSMYSAYRWFPKEELFERRFPLSGLPTELQTATVHVGDIFSQMVMGNLVHTSTVLLRRERFEKVKAFNPELRHSGEDYDFHLRTCRAGAVAFVDVASIQYQRGLEDRLTRPAYRIHIAQNFLKTLEPILKQDRARIRLPGSMVRHVHAESHAWIGEEAIALNEQALGIAHLARSLSIRPWQPRIARLLVLALLPKAPRDAVRRLYKWLKSHSQPLQQAAIP